MEHTIQPVLLGADMNCYSMARAFHEAYGVTAKAYGRWAMGETKYSRIVDFTPVPDVDTDEGLLSTLGRHAKAYPSETKILLGCTDDYAALLIRHRDELSKEYIVPYINQELMDKLEAKEAFYAYCREYGLPYPETVVLHPGEDPAVLDDLPFQWPVIVKPSSSIDYWKHPFEGMQKVYEAESAGQAKEITKRIFESGYPESIIVQDRIPGADSAMRVLTAYCDRSAKVKMVCLGHVLLEEHTPKAVGNHAAILTEVDRPLMEKLAAFLEAIEFTGFANFDIKFDERDGQYKVFEINLRQGRSNYYVTGAGLNLARYLVEDRVEGRDLGAPLYFEGEHFWHSIPERIVWQYTGDEALARRARELARAGKDTTALDYAYDLRWNPLRWLYVKEHYRRYYEKYKTYCIKQRD